MKKQKDTIEFHTPNGTIKMVAKGSRDGVTIFEYHCPQGIDSEIFIAFKQQHEKEISNFKEKHYASN
jgi:hypothetical protein